MKEGRTGNDYEVKLDDAEQLQEMKDLNSQTSDDSIEENILRSVLEKDKKAKDEGTLIGEAINQGISAFNPDMMFENIVNNYSMAKKVYGETLIRLLSGYNPDFVERNIKIPEFKRELKKRLQDSVNNLKEDGFINKDLSISEDGLKLASLIMYADELEHMMSKGMFGEKVNKKPSHYGERGEAKTYRKGDRYKDIAIKDSLKLAIRRGHHEIIQEDLKTSHRQSRGQVSMIYALDASGSMKGKKIEMSKKAGVALAYKAIEAKDKVGLIIFGSEIKEEIAPTDDFPLLLKEITKIKASKQTNFKEMLNKALEMFPPGDFTKHLLILTDAMPTVGENPEKESLEEVSKIRNAGITVSLIGINLDSETRSFAEKIAEIGEGKLYIVKEVEELDTIVLEDYYSVSG